ncbi:hypothetical protein AX16_002270 [Volvariella volvacea WC 439]|nr:hypothetical protein AX16_002270 [Volvariella volvacea WC 439]
MHDQRQSSLCRLPPELLDAIFFELIGSDDALDTASTANHGPLGQLFPVLLSCRYFHNYLNPHKPASAALYRRIFLHKFDTTAVVRRAFSPHSANYLDQFILYQEYLHIIASGDVDRPTAPDALYMAYIMLLENDGKNREQLERVGVYQFAKSWVNKHLYDGCERNAGWPVVNDANACALWIMWMCTTEERLRAESDTEINAFIEKILPFVANPYRYTSAEAPPNHFSLPLPSSFRHLIYKRESQLFSRIETAHGPYPIYYDGRTDTSQVHYSSRPAMHTPSITIPAKLLYFVRRELIPFPVLRELRRTRAQADAEGVTDVGPTQEDIIEVNEGSSVRLVPSAASSSGSSLPPTYPHPLSSIWDHQWDRARRADPFESEKKRRARLSGKRQKYNRSLYEPGMLTGLWQGRILFPNTILLHQFLQVGEYPPEGFSESSLGFVTLPFFVRFQEHVCYYPDEPVPSYVSTSTPTPSQAPNPANASAPTHPQHRHLHTIRNSHLASLHHENLQNGWFPHPPTFPPCYDPRSPFFSTSNHAVAGDRSDGTGMGPMTMFHFDSEKGGRVKIRLTDGMRAARAPAAAAEEWTEWTYETWEETKDMKHNDAECERCRQRDEWNEAQREREQEEMRSRPGTTGKGKEQAHRGRGGRSASPLMSVAATRLAPREEDVFRSVGLGRGDDGVRDMDDDADADMEGEDEGEEEDEEILDDLPNPEDTDAETPDTDESDEWTDSSSGASSSGSGSGSSSDVDSDDGDAGVYDAEGRVLFPAIRPAREVWDGEQERRPRRYAFPDEAGMDVESEASDVLSSGRRMRKKTKRLSRLSSSESARSRSGKRTSAAKPSRKPRSTPQTSSTCRGIRDIIITGTTDHRHGQAWNDYVYFGRVRSWDGLVGILRRPKRAELGDLFMYGYVVGGKGGVEVDLKEGLLERFTSDAGAPDAGQGAGGDASANGGGEGMRGTPGCFVGNWRNVFDIGNLPPYESAFIMTRRAE